MEQMIIEDTAGNSLTIHDLNDASVPYFVMPPIDGLEFPTIRTGEYDNAGTDGINITSQYTGERRVNITGKAFQSINFADFVTKRRNFLNMCRPRRDANGALIIQTLRFKAMDGNTYRLIGRVVDATMPIEYPNQSTFTIDFLATSAVIEDYTASSASLNPLTPGGFILPVILPIVFDSGTGGSVTINSTGNEDAYPIFTLTGPLTNPRIYNAASGKYMALTLSITGGQTVVIDMLNKTVVLGGTTSEMSTLTSDSSFWPLNPGSSLLTLSTSVNGEAGSVSIVWRNAYTGV
jgi:hypothetical protein